MDEDRKNWPIVIGVTAGILGGIVAGIYLYSVKAHEEPEIELRDAREIIAQCHEKIREIEAGLDTLKQPLMA